MYADVFIKEGLVLEVIYKKSVEILKIIWYNKNIKNSK